MSDRDLVTATAVAPGARRSGRPVFVGARSGELPEHLIYSYMTAEQMQARVTSLTGYEHPDFITFADILGHNDPQSGTRTNSEPSLLGVLLMQKVAAEVAAMVIERELFLHDAERLVFNGIALDQVPSDAALEVFCSGLYQRWLGVPLAAISLHRLTGLYKQAQTAGGPTAAYRALLALMLEHGGLYYA